MFYVNYFLTKHHHKTEYIYAINLVWIAAEIGRKYLMNSTRVIVSTKRDINV